MWKLYLQTGQSADVRSWVIQMLMELHDEAAVEGNTAVAAQSWTLAWDLEMCSRWTLPSQPNTRPCPSG